MKKILSIALALAAMASCQQDEIETGSNKIAAQFSHSAITRVTASTWEAGDAIGIYMVAKDAAPSDANAIQGAKNICYNTAATGTTVTFVPSDPTQEIFFPSDDSAVDFYAYYPFQISMADGVYKIDASRQDTPAAIDLLTAKVANKDQTAPSVEFAFAHRLTKLSLTLVANDDVTAAQLAGITASIEGLPATADYHLATGTPTNPGAATPITARVNADGTFAEAILIPQASIAAGSVKVVFTLTNGMKPEWKFPLTALAEGKDYQHTLRIGRAGVTLTSQNILDWTAGNGTAGESGTVENILVTTYSPGDYYPDPKVTFSAPGVVSSGTAPIGIVYWIDNMAQGYIPTTEHGPEHGLVGKIVSLDETTSIWGPEDVTTGASDHDDGIPNMAKIQALAGWETAYPAFKWCADKATGGRTWYLPAFRELLPLNKLFLKDKDALKSKLTAAGGTAINEKQIYWSSSEPRKDKSPQTHATYLDLNLDEGAYSTKTTQHSVRAVATFSNHPGSVTGITLNKPALTFSYGTTATLIATVTPSIATNKAVTWTSSNAAIATVDATGKITPVTSGGITITATTVDGGLKASCLVNIFAPVTGITLNKTSLSVEVNSKATLTPTIAPDFASNKTVSWRSSDPAVATVTDKGEVTGLKVGTATITATAGMETATCQVVVTGLNMGNGGGVDL